MDRKVKLNGVAIQGQTLTSPRTPNLIIGNDAGYIRGDILDANAVATKINEVIAGAPEALDTLKELADAMQDNPQLITDMKNQIDPFFTPNQNNKIDTYDDLKNFFDDTTPDYNYTKDTTIQANTLIYDSVNNVWGIREGDPILEYASNADYAWIDFGNGNEGRMAICRNTPDYTNSPVIRLDDTHDCKLCLTLNADGTFGTISVQDNAVPLSYSLCSVYAVNAEPYFKTFEERLQGFFDPNVTGKIDTLDMLRPFLDGSELQNTEYITLPPPRNFESDQINGESGVWISDENEDPIIIQSNVAPEQIFLNMASGGYIGGYPFTRIEDTGDYYTYTYFSSALGSTYNVAKIYVAKYNIPNTEVQDGDVFFVLQPGVPTSALLGIQAIIYDNKYNDGEIKSLSNIIDTKLDKTYVVHEINPDYEGAYSFIRLDNGSYVPQIMLYCVNPNTTPITYSYMNIGDYGIRINSTGSIFAQGLSIHPEIKTDQTTTSISCGYYYNYSDVTSSKNVLLGVPSGNKDIVGTIYIHVKFTGSGSMTFTSSDHTTPIKYSDWTAFAVGNEYEIIARYVKTAWILSNHVLT